MAKDDQVLIKLSGKEKEGFQRAAELTGVGFSAWARQLLRVAATKVLQDAGEPVPFLEPKKEEPKESGEQKSPEQAAELFRGIMKASVKGKPKNKKIDE